MIPVLGFLRFFICVLTDSNSKSILTFTRPMYVYVLFWLVCVCDDNVYSRIVSLLLSMHVKCGNFVSSSQQGSLRLIEMIVSLGVFPFI